MFDNRRRTRRGDENGFAMVVCVVVASVAILLSTAMLAQGVHLIEATSYDRRWNNALQVSEAGVERAVVRLIENSAFSGTFTETVPFGEFVATVTAPAPGVRLIDSIGYSPSQSSPVARKRRIVVRYGPAPTFAYAVFSATTMELNNINNNCIQGDVFANQTIVSGNNTCVAGNVISATGSISFGNGSEVRKKVDGSGGSVFSGGLGPSGADWGIDLPSNNVKVFGSAHAQRDVCPNPPVSSTQYKIIGSGVISEDAVAGSGPIGPTVLGTAKIACETASPADPLPTFRIGEINTLYQPETVTTFNSVAAFQAVVDASPSNLSGYFYVNDPSATTPIDLTGVTVTDTLVLVTDALIQVKNVGGGLNVTVANPDTDFVHIISLNSSTTPPAIDINNNFTVNATPTKPPVLLYSEGYIEIKNSTLSNGAVYGNPVNVKNNLDITYDPRVESILGFGSERFVRLSWNERSAS